jgi:ribosomal protein S18 acetylase RimI-like enzyme
MREDCQIQIRDAEGSDAKPMSAVLQELIAAERRQKPGDRAFVLSHYLEHPDRLRCFVAIDDAGEVLGFQSLKLASPSNPYGTPSGWGIIGTHIRPSAARRGVGRSLFGATLATARQAQLPAIEAYIGEENGPALAYYDAMGFKTHRRPDRAICKVFRLHAGPLDS